MPINLEISLITQPTFRCGFPVKLYIWGTSTEITYEYVLSHNWALLLIGWTKFSATQKHQIVRKDWVMIWHQYGISAHIPWASFCRESPVLGSHVSMSVFSGYIVVGFNQCKARLTAGSTLNLLLLSTAGFHRDLGSRGFDVPDYCWKSSWRLPKTDNTYNKHWCYHGNHGFDNPVFKICIFFKLFIDCMIIMHLI